MGLLSKVAGYATGFNWYKLAAEAIVVLSLLAGAYGYGVHNCEIKHEHQQTIAATNKAKRVQSEVTKRVPETQRLDRKAESVSAGIKVTGDKLHESLAKNPTSNTCTFSDEQLRLFRELAAATHGK